jgi:Dolichyl-phosphate-mannose-protein mannosyltransferase
MPRVKVDLGAESPSGDQLSALPRGIPLLHPLLVTLLSIFAIAPLTYPGFFQNHAGFDAVYNLMDLDSHLAAGLAWAPTFGRGYDLLRMDGPFPYFAAELFHLLGVSADGSIKLVFTLGFVLSGIAMYLLARRVFKNEGAGLLAAVVYVYFPYHLADVYVRGALGEATEWVLIPFAVNAVFYLRSLGSHSLRSYLLVGLVFAMTILTQPGLATLFALGVLGASLLARWRGLMQAPFTEWPICLGVLMGAVVLAPSFLSNQSLASYYIFTPAFVYPFQFLTASWGHAVPRGNYLDQFPYQLGIAAIGLTILASALLIWAKDSPLKPDRRRRIVLYAAIGGAAALVLMTPVAAPLWTITGATSFVEYPFQLLPFVGLALSITAGAVVIGDARLAQAPMLAALVVVPILTVYSYLSPEFLDFSPAKAPLALFNHGEVALLDAKIARPPGIFRHGATVELDLQWQALRQVNHDYTVFVHVLDSTGKEWGGDDTKPQNGALPTLQWDVGRVISDTHTVQIDLTGPPEGYHLEVGLYTALNGKRALTESGATEIRIEENDE